jgi:hypothetical protein
MFDRASFGIRFSTVVVICLFVVTIEVEIISATLPEISLIT